MVLISVLQSVMFLFSFGKSERQFVDAAANGNLDEVMRLVAAGVDVDSMERNGMPSETHSMCSYILISYTGYTALMNAIMRDHTPIVQYLLENGAHVDALDNRSMSNLSI